MSSSQFVITAGSTVLMTSLTILVSGATKPRLAWEVRCKQMKKADQEIPGGMLMTYTFSGRSTGKFPGISGIFEKVVLLSRWK